MTGLAQEGSDEGLPMGARARSWRQRLLAVHGRVPLIQKLPPRAVAIIVLLLLANAVAWAVVGVVSHFHPSLPGTAVLAWTLGLRHALDADHISCIDLLTRRLISAGQRPVTIGTFFSLGHSTIVIITSILVAATANEISHRFGGFAYVGGIVGTSVSATFLLLLGVANAYLFLLLLRQFRQALDQYARGEPVPSLMERNIGGGGVMFRVARKMFRLVDRPWKVYPVGVLFGLGFDTSSQVALLGISAVESIQGVSTWIILVFPLLFTVGMCLNDTIDGALMYTLYTMSFGLADEKPQEESDATVVTDCLTEPSQDIEAQSAHPKSCEDICAAAVQSSSKTGSPISLQDGGHSAPKSDAASKSPRVHATTLEVETGSAAESPTPVSSDRIPGSLRLLYYQTILTFLTVLIALFIGILQLLSLVVAIRDPQGSFWDGVNAIEDHFDALGGAICGAFVVVAVSAALGEKKVWKHFRERARARVLEPSL